MTDRVRLYPLCKSLKRSLQIQREKETGRPTAATANGRKKQGKKERPALAPRRRRRRRRSPSSTPTILIVNERNGVSSHPGVNYRRRYVPVSTSRGRGYQPPFTDLSPSTMRLLRSSSDLPIIR
ncbi:uncharacterized protein LOC124408483 [Diprion similis]|uniref:uncharacterized protein LOC124408483 n=1 Tax=Diprion similis TaxID=362088 RepID=UPI001EF806A2|nr:uncharacterized protein LOC124408483 [Diprion similis]